jgi:nicotinate-nucleotide adenylyltransferase
MIRTALFFGSFNPIHIGHLIVASAAAEQDFVDEVWLVPSPQNPLKATADLATADHRLSMARLATAEDPGLSVSDIEFQLDIPSYTIQTLRALRERHSERVFSMLCGTDLLASFHKWKDYESILETTELLIYPRYSHEQDPGIIDWEKYRLRPIDAPRVEISSTYIRAKIQQSKSIRYLVSESVAQYIREQKLYQQ